MILVLAWALIMYVLGNYFTPYLPYILTTLPGSFEVGAEFQLLLPYK